jgi:demethylmacrocin O-methyltransferase
VLEIGVGSGASLFAWRDYFPNASILGVDNHPRSMILGEARITTYLGSQDVREELMFFANGVPVTYDLIIDDGCHVLHSQLLSLFFLYPYLNPGGIYVIEDVQDPENLRCWQQLPSAKIFDRRAIKNRYDDILIALRKPQH